MKIFLIILGVAALVIVAYVVLVHIVGEMWKH